MTHFTTRRVRRGGRRLAGAHRPVWRGALVRAVCCVAFLLVLPAPGLGSGDAGSPGRAAGREDAAAAARADSLREEAWRGFSVGRITCHGNAHTHDRVILQEFLLAPGDPYQPELRRETERNLRARPYLGSAEIEARFDPVREVVDLDAAVTERWAWVVAPLPTLEGDRVDLDLILAHLNFLGLGQIIGFQTTQSSENEDTYFFYFEEPRVAGSRWGSSLSLGHQKDTGNRFRLTMKRPLYCLSARWAFDAAVFDESFEQRLYHGGFLSSNYVRRNRGGSAGVSRSFRRDDRRLELTWRGSYRRETNEQREGWNGVLPDDKRRFTMTVGASAEWFRYVRDRYFLQLGPVEDLKLGPRVSLDAGGILDTQGAERAVPTLGAGFSWWAGTTGRGYAALSLDADSRIENGGFTNIVAGGSLRLYRWLTERGYLAWRGQAYVLEKMEDPVQLRLDSVNGLRGYEPQALDGTRRLLANIEWRQVAWETERLVTGVVLFTDLGMIWDENGSARDALLHAGSGGGLRLGFPTIYGAPLVRLDLGYGFRPGTWLASAGLGQRF